MPTFTLPPSKATDDRPWLTQDLLEQHDPGAPHARGHRRYLCPLPACRDHQEPRKDRSVSVDQSSGAWKCHRCSAHGQLEDFRGDSRFQTGKQRARSELAAKLAIRPAVVAELRPTPSGQPIADAYAALSPLHGTPGATYLEGRGIRVDLAEAAGVRFTAAGQHGCFGGHAGVVFPVVDVSGGVVALSCRYLGDLTPNKRSVGTVSAGVFATCGALKADPVAICEAPIDALSLAGAGLPALALVGTGVSGRSAWLRKALALRTVYAATDADTAGDKAADELAASLNLGTQVERLRPPAPYKDWNEAFGNQRIPMSAAEKAYQDLYPVWAAKHDELRAARMAGSPDEPRLQQELDALLAENHRLRAAM